MDEKEKREHLVIMLLYELGDKFTTLEEECKTCKFLEDNDLDVTITKKDKEYLHSMIEYKCVFYRIEYRRHIHKIIDNLPSNLKKCYKTEYNVPTLIMNIFNGYYSFLTDKMKEEKRKNKLDLDEKINGKKYEYKK